MDIITQYEGDMNMLKKDRLLIAKLIFVPPILSGVLYTIAFALAQLTRGARETDWSILIGTLAYDIHKLLEDDFFVELIIFGIPGILFLYYLYQLIQRFIQEGSGLFSLKD